MHDLNLYIQFVSLRSDFVNTAVTDEDWVCELKYRPTKLFTIATVGIIIGTALFSLFADFKGRKPAFFFAVVIVIVFQLIQIGAVGSYIAYTIVKVTGMIFKYFPFV